MSISEKQKKARRPLRRAKNWGRPVFKMAGRLLLIAAVTLVLGLMFSALQGIPSAVLRTTLTLVIAAGVLMMLFNEGLNRGFADTEASHQAMRLEKEGKTLTKKDDQACFHPLKPLCAALLAFGIPLVLSVYLALTAEPYTYMLQDLPNWVSGAYSARSDVMAPLASYLTEVTMGAKDMIRMIVRMVILLYVNLFSDPQKMLLMIDRLSPLMVLTYPIAYLAGYLRGPASYQKRRSMQRKAKKVAVRKASRSKMADELLGEGKQVHYGQKAEEHKKKELI